MKEERITITLYDLGDITATKDAFNELAIVFGEASKQYCAVGCFALEKKAEKIRNTIHGELDKRGYYNIFKS
jgi:hypothetical protein